MNTIKFLVVAITFLACLHTYYIPLAFCQNNIHEIEIFKSQTTDNKLKPLQGVITGPLHLYNYGIADLTSRLQDIGVTSIRNNNYMDDWLDIEGIFRCPDDSIFPSWECDANDPSNYYWAPSDKLFQKTIDGGFEPFLRIGGSENCSIREYEFHGPQNTLQEDNWIIAAKKIIAHYDNWQGKNHVLSYIDIFTEWPNSKFWDRSNQDFIRFWTRAFKEIKDAFPHLKVGGPGFLGPTIDVIDGKVKKNLAVAFLAYLYSHGLKPDWIGWHLWQNDPRKYILAAKQFRNLLDGKGDFASVPWAGTEFFKDVELICDAYGLSYYDFVDGTIIKKPKEEQFRLNNKKDGAAILTGTWIALQYSNIERAFYYRSADPNSDPSAGPYSKNRGWSGLFYGDENLSYKPKTYAFRLWSLVYKNFPHLLNTPLPSVAQDGSKLWVLAAQNKNSIGVLVSNLQGYPVRYNLYYEGKRILSQNFHVAIYQVDDVQNGRNASMWHGETLLIPAKTVQLLVMVPKTYEADSEGLDFYNIFSDEELHGVWLNFFLPSPNNITLKVLDLAGNHITTIFDNKTLQGEIQVFWNGQTGDNYYAPFGMYSFVLEIENGHKSVKRIGYLPPD